MVNPFSSNNIDIKITASNQQLKGKLRETSTDISGFARKSSSLLGTAFSMVAPIAGFVGLSSAMTGSVSAFREFEKGFTNVKTLLNEGSFATKTLKEGAADLEKQLLILAQKSGENFQVLNKGLFDLISAEVEADDAMHLLRVSTDLAGAGATTTAIAVDGITNALGAYGLANSEAEMVAKKFFTAQIAGKTTIQEIAQNFGIASSLAFSYGVSLDELLASTAAATQGGSSLSENMTGLKAVISGVSAPTKSAGAEAKRLGIQFDATALRSQGLSKFLDSITQSANFNSDTMSKLFGSMEAVKFVLAITGAQADLFKKTLSNMNDEQLLAQNYAFALAESQSTVDRAMNKIGATIDVTKIKLGELFKPFLLWLAEVLPSFVNRTVLGFRVISNTFGNVADRVSLGFNTIKTIVLNVVDTLITRFTYGFQVVEIGFNKLQIASRTFALGFIKDFQEVLNKFKEVSDIIPGFSPLENATKSIDNFVSNYEKSIDHLKNKNEELIASQSQLGSGLQGRVEGRREELGQLAVDTQGNIEGRQQNIRDDFSNFQKAETFDTFVTGEGVAKPKKPIRPEGEGEEDEDTKYGTGWAAKELKARKALAEQLGVDPSEVDDAAIANFLAQEEMKYDAIKNSVGTIVQLEREKQQQLIDDEKKYGKTIAGVKNKFIDNELVANARKVAGLLGQEEGFARASVMIAKAAAIPQAIMDIQQAIAGAVKAGASQPFPKNLPAIAAGVVAVAGQTAGVISSIKGANFKANLGGVVPGIGNTDTVPTMLTPGELVIPKQITPTFFDIMKNTSSGGENSGGVQEILIKIQPEEFADFITTEITNRQRANAVLGI